MKSRPFEQLFSVGTGFCMGFLKKSKTDHNPFLFKNRKYKAKVAQIKRFKRLMLSCCTTVDFCLHAKNQFTRVHDIKKSAERALLKFQVE